MQPQSSVYGNAFTILKSQIEGMKLGSPCAAACSKHIATAETKRGVGSVNSLSSFKPYSVVMMGHGYFIDFKGPLPVSYSMESPLGAPGFR